MKFENKEFIERRKKLFEKLDDFSITILFSGRAKITSYDETFPLVTNRNFLYLTHIDQEDSVLVLVKTPSYKTEYLFIQKYDELKEKWTGIRLKNEEARELSGIDNILYFDNLEPKVDILIKELLNETSQVKIYLDLDKELKIDECFTTEKFGEKLKSKYENDVVIENIYEEIIKIRAVKSNAEIEALKEAINITNVGLKAVLSELGPDKMEYQMASNGCFV